jgi:hypothetical protein
MLSKSSLGYEMVFKKNQFRCTVCVAQCSTGCSFWTGLGRFWEQSKCGVTTLPTCSYQLTEQGKKCNNSCTKYS